MQQESGLYRGSNAKDATFFQHIELGPSLATLGVVLQAIDGMQFSESFQQSYHIHVDQLRHTHRPMARCEDRGLRVSTNDLWY